MWISTNFIAACLYALATPIVVLMSANLKPLLASKAPSTLKQQLLTTGFVCILWTFMLYFLFNDPDSEGPSMHNWVGFQFSVLGYAGVLSVSSLTLVLSTGKIIHCIFTEESEEEFTMQSFADYIALPVF